MVGGHTIVELTPIYLLLFSSDEEPRDFLGGSGSGTASFKVRASAPDPAPGHTMGQKILSMRVTESDPDKIPTMIP